MFVLLILEDISELMELMDLLPVCARCKEVMDDSQVRQTVKQQFKEHLSWFALIAFAPNAW